MDGSRDGIQTVQRKNSEGVRKVISAERTSRRIAPPPPLAVLCLLVSDSTIWPVDYGHFPASSLLFELWRVRSCLEIYRPSAGDRGVFHSIVSGISFSLSLPQFFFIPPGIQRPLHHMLATWPAALSYASSFPVYLKSLGGIYESHTLCYCFRKLYNSRSLPSGRRRRCVYYKAGIDWLCVRSSPSLWRSQQCLPLPFFFYPVAATTGNLLSAQLLRARLKGVSHFSIYQRIFFS